MGSVYASNVLSDIQHVDHTQHYGKRLEAIGVIRREIEDKESFAGPHSELWAFQARKLLHHYRIAKSASPSKELTTNVENADERGVSVQQISLLKNKI